MNGSASIQSLRKTSAQLMTEKHPSEVKLAATNSVASLWLLPRLRKFNVANEDMNITLISSDDDLECLSDANDLSILRGDGDWPDHTSQKLFGETIFPVCAPSFLEDTPEDVSLDSLPNLPLIEVTSKHSEWMNWTDWLRGHVPGVPSLNRKSMFNAYPHAIQAAVDGLGIALGWGHLVDHLLDRGTLVRPLGDIHTRTEFGYYLLCGTDVVQSLVRAVTLELSWWFSLFVLPQTFRSPIFFSYCKWEGA